MSVQAVANTTEFWSADQKELIKRTICIGITDDELKLFSYVCQKTGLDPFSKQIYAVKRKTKYGEMMTIQTSIDGYRLIADRSERYSPGQKPSYLYDKSGNLVAATSYVKKMTKDGTWHIIEAEAAFSEYCQVDFKGVPSMMWAKMPRVMLAKCAEALALKKAFPAELSGIYTDVEMDQADNPTTLDVTPKPQALEKSDPIPLISTEQVKELQEIIPDVPTAIMDSVWSVLKSRNQNKLEDIPAVEFARLRDHLKNNRKVQIANVS